jgi:hypothetical protein
MIRFLADASLHHAIVTGCVRREPALDFLSAASRPENWTNLMAVIPLR